MRQVGVLEAKTQLSALLDAVERHGEEVVITRHGRPVAYLTRAPEGGGAARRTGGRELVARLSAFRQRVMAEHPALAELTTDEILALREP